MKQTIIFFVCSNGMEQIKNERNETRNLVFQSWFFCWAFIVVIVYDWSKERRKKDWSRMKIIIIDEKMVMLVGVSVGGCFFWNKKNKVMVNNDNGYGKNEWMNGSTQKPKNQARKFFVFNCYSSIGTQNFFHSHFFRLCWHICSKTTKKKSGKKRMLFWLFLNYSFVCLFAISISILDFFV